MASVASAIGMTLAERSRAPKLRLQRMRGLVDHGATIAALPTEPNTAHGNGPWILWLGPAEWLVYSIEQPLDALRAIADPFVSANTHVCADVTSGLTLIEIAGPGAVDALAAGCGLDLAGGAVPLNGCAQSHYHHAPIILHRPQAGNVWRLFVDRPLSRYLRDSLERTS